MGGQAAEPVGVAEEVTNVGLCRHVSIIHPALEVLGGRAVFLVARRTGALLHLEVDQPIVLRHHLDRHSPEAGEGVGGP
jgi:hypothetical protein